jgi:glycosyltransferase involved in cell wall biosynthesis
MNVLIAKLGATGDVVRTTTLLSEFRDHVTWITEAKNTPLLRDLRANLRCLSWEERDAAGDRRYDLGINLEDTAEVARFVSKLQLKQLFGAFVDSGNELKYTEESRPWFDLSLISVYGREAADKLKLQNRRTYQELIFGGLGLTFRGEGYLLPKPVETGLSGDIAISAQAGPVWPMKNWAFYDELKQKLEAEGLTVNVLPKRASLLEHLNDVRNHRCIVGGDSLPMHFALGSNKPCVTLFICTSPWEIYDYGLQTKIVSPLLAEFFYKRGYDLRATTAIGVDEVFDATICQLRRAGSDRGCANRLSSSGQRTKRAAQIRNAPVSLASGASMRQADSPPHHSLSSADGSLRVAVFTGGFDKPYALGLASSLISQGVALDFIGNDEVDGPELHQSPLVRFLNLLGDQGRATSSFSKALRALTYYGRLVLYALTDAPKVFHILWNNGLPCSNIGIARKLELLHRTLFLLCYRLFGKRIAFTAHNVNVARRDGNDTFVNRLTLRIQYRLVDHLFVHTEQMKQELQSDFGVPAHKISVIPFGINSTVPNTALTSIDARQRVGLSATHKAMLFFGRIAPYKGLEYLVDAIAVLGRTDPEYRLLIVGQLKNSAPYSYWEEIQQRITRFGLRSNVIERIGYVPDEETEIYFKAADVLVLPYTHIFQSGVLFLGYNFGLPVIASDVGSFKEDIVEGGTGFVCKPRDPVDLAKNIETYFSSELYQQLAARRPEIRDFANDRHSWTKVGEITRAVYAKLVARR